jgi:outer membrane protein OmpA-like peptidoglycan-associated protein
VDAFYQGPEGQHSAQALRQGIEREADIEAVDFAGNIFRVKEKFSVDTSLAEYSAAPESRIFEPGTNARIVFKTGDGAKIKKWDLEIFDSSGALVRAFRNRSVAVSYAEWDGTNAANVFVRAGSAYRCRVTVTQKNEIVTSREFMIQTKLPVFTSLGMRLTLAAVDFTQGSSDIPAEKYEFINQAAEAVERYARDYYLFIKGYAADSVNAEENLQLSLDRAMQVRDYLVKEKGIPPGNIYVNGLGDGEYTEEVTRGYIEKNSRRVEVELITK